MKMAALFLNFLILSAHFQAYGECNNSVVCVRSQENYGRPQVEADSGSKIDFESSLLLKVNQSNDRIEITRKKVEDLFYIDPSGYDEAIKVGAYAVGQGPLNGRFADSFGQVLESLKRHSDSYSTDEKLLILKEAANRLGYRYDYSLSNQQSSEDIFNNAKVYGARGGICGDIHHYIAQMASALGFEDAGVHTLKWFQDGNSGAGHIVSHFRDPKTGLYYIENYGAIIGTNARDLATAVDVSTKIHGPLTNLSLIEGRPGVFHAYTPEVASWIYGQVDRLLGDKSNTSKVIIEAGSDNRFLGVKLVSQTPIGQISGFVLSKEEMTSGGRYQASILGIEFLHSDELGNQQASLGYTSLARLGYLNLIAPTYGGAPPLDQYNYNTGYIEAGVTGYARINRTTGEIEMNVRNADGRINDGGTPLVKMKLRLRQDLGPAQVEVERGYVNSRDNYDRFNNVMSVEADRISIIIDARSEGAEKAYLKFQGDYYFLEGVDAHSAQAVRVQLMGFLPEKILQGELHVVLDVSKIISNPQNDALYRYFNQNTAVALRISWERQVRKNVIVGVAGEISNGRMYPLFQESRQNLDSYQNGPERRWTAYLRVAF